MEKDLETSIDMWAALVRKDPAERRAYNDLWDNYVLRGKKPEDFKPSARRQLEMIKKVLDNIEAVEAMERQ